jgi:hypothetical protein
MSILGKAWQWLRRSDRLWSPRGFTVRAVVLAALFLLCGAAGLKQYTAALSGTAPAGSSARLLYVLLGALYIGSYLGFAVLAPILVLAAGIWAASDQAVRRLLRRPGCRSPDLPGPERGESFPARTDMSA